MHPPASVNSGGETPENTDDSSTVRTYRAWKGNNIFFLQGRFMFGPDVKSLIITIFLVVAPVAVFCAFVARKLMLDFPQHFGYSILILVIIHTVFVLIALLMTSGRDPGIVPRNLYPPVPVEYNESVGINIEPNHPPRYLPRFKEVIINGITVKVKYCHTCMLYRPPRCSHCSICDNCVERRDHHCTLLGQCIGLRNYRSFYVFIFSMTLLCLYIHGYCWVYIKGIQVSEEISIWQAMKKTPVSIALIVYSLISGVYVGILTIFHTYLISTNQTTDEKIGYRSDPQISYDKGVIENFKEVFFSSTPPSKNNFRSKIPIPKELSEYGNATDLSKMLHTESEHRQVASFQKDSLWEQSGKKLQINLEVQDKIHDTESNWITHDNSNDPAEDSEKQSYKKHI